MWKTIEISPNYEVSINGQVRNIKTGRILKLRVQERGYLRVHISVNGKYKTLRVHRLVAQAFIFNPNDKPQVNHKDGDKSNNSVDNLEWVTGEENIAHAIKLGLSIAAIGVVQYTLEGKYINEYESLTKAAKAVEGKTCGIQLVCNGKRQQHKGYVWRFK